MCLVSKPLLDNVHQNPPEPRHSLGYEVASFDLTYNAESMDFLRPAGFLCLGCNKVVQLYADSAQPSCRRFT